ncbi:hypothetical protein NUU61_002905 [Penicillium alfredii]|uniref:Diaminohydroxyphosphoribosylamino-pyrimidine deaminase n=1 Tax=Penicillium alfredii TaxID=1506179 RepID=A0A9W9FSK1_9EURO|nr:uncharacterized protein NUU61_002905 [Penicillium alfredii]KAJ5105558.1 hypothetical protein NUU61_002905 [Penicillium alfredii]
MSIPTFLASIGDEVTDADEGTHTGPCTTPGTSPPAKQALILEFFLLFAQDITTANLGFVDSRATTVDIIIHDTEYCIHQSPSLLSSSRAGGTTGAVLWKITPLLAEWLTAPSNPLRTHNILTPSSVVAELGCGISALVALALAPSVRHYIATDQEYVHRLFRTNVDANAGMNTGVKAAKPARSSRKKAAGTITGTNTTTTTTTTNQSNQNNIRNITFTSLDWELDQPGLLRDCIGYDDDDDDDQKDRGVDLLLSCDCIYNEALVAPFVRTCAEICRLRPAYESSASPENEHGAQSRRRPTVCIVAQQQRSPEVFDVWLRETLREFRVWRVRDEVLGGGLGGGTGRMLIQLIMDEFRDSNGRIKIRGAETSK